MRVVGRGGGAGGELKEGVVESAFGAAVCRDVPGGHAAEAGAPIVSFAIEDEHVEGLFQEVDEGEEGIAAWLAPEEVVGRGV